MLPKSGYPFAMLHLRVDPAAIDVNVHPAKTEIKFSDEQAVYRAIYRSIVTASSSRKSRKTWPRRLNRRQKKRRWQRRAFRNFTLPRPIRPPTSGTSSPVSAAPLPEAATLFTVDKGPSAAERNSLREEPSPAVSFTSRPASASLRQERTYEHRFVRATAAASFPRPWPSTVRWGRCGCTR